MDRKKPDSYMSERNGLEICSKRLNLISYVQKLRKVNISIRDCLPQDFLISHHDLKRVQKINFLRFLLSITICITRK
ncbi:hypothetical protein HanPSC8_Chr08g0316651 [Helianthus annuus]|nr:hypothetical protein HanPSC8_Chr08g0316651 [Helianthus annuus]